MLSLLPSALFTSHMGQSGGRGLSPRLWSKAYGQAQSPDGAANAYFVSDDFLSFGGTVTSNVGTYAGEAGMYKSYEDSGGSIAGLATEVGGVIRLLTDADTNDENWLQSGYSSGNLGVISDTAGADKLMIFEARIRPNQIIAGTGGFFVGLGEEGLAAADTMDDSGDLASKDLIGFATNEDDPDALTFIYRKASQTMQTVLTYGTALTAAGWLKVGFVYDPKAAPAKRISIYVNNVEQSTYVTATNIAAATFPDGEEMAFLAGIKNVTDIQSLDLDWWAFFQAG